MPTLDHASLVHDADPVGHGQRLALVVSDVDRGDAERPLQILDPVLHFLAKILVERAQRLVEQEDARLGDQDARQRHPLLLAAAELRAGIGAS